MEGRVKGWKEEEGRRRINWAPLLDRPERRRREEGVKVHCEEREEGLSRTSQISLYNDPHSPRPRKSTHANPSQPLFSL